MGEEDPARESPDSRVMRIYLSDFVFSPPLLSDVSAAQLTVSLFKIKLSKDPLQRLEPKKDLATLNFCLLLLATSRNGAVHFTHAPMLWRCPGSIPTLIHCVGDQIKDCNSEFGSTQRFVNISPILKDKLLCMQKYRKNTVPETQRTVEKYGPW